MTDCENSCTSDGMIAVLMLRVGSWRRHLLLKIGVAASSNRFLEKGIRLNGFQRHTIFGDIIPKSRKMVDAEAYITVSWYKDHKETREKKSKLSDSSL
jgi:hypothetical protein